MLGGFAQKGQPTEKVANEYNSSIISQKKVTWQLIAK